MPFADRTSTASSPSRFASPVIWDKEDGQRDNVYARLAYVAQKRPMKRPMVMNVRLPSCDSWAITFYQDFCKTPVTVNIDGKMQLGMVINATVANNAKTLAPDRCEQYCETIGGTWKNADERENWANLNPFGCYTLKRDSLLGLETTCWFIASLSPRSSSARTRM